MKHKLMYATMIGCGISTTAGVSAMMGDFSMLSVLSGVAVAVAVGFGFPKRADPTEEIKKQFSDLEKLNNFDKTTQKEVIDAIHLGTQKLDNILIAAAGISGPNTVRRIKKIDSIGRKIISNFQTDPKDVKVARSWLNSYLDETLLLVQQYASVSRKGTRNLEAQKILADFDKMLDEMEEHFQKLLDSLIDNDVMDLDVTMAVMKNRLQNEGM